MEDRITEPGEAGSPQLNGRRQDRVPEQSHSWAASTGRAGPAWPSGQAWQSGPGRAHPLDGLGGFHDQDRATRPLPAAWHPARRDRARAARPLLRRRKRLSHLARESRLPAWRARLLIALGAGVLFTVWLNWRIGLIAAVLAAAADTLIRSRLTAAGAAEGLTSAAQRRTKRQLGGLERAGYRSLHIRAIPGSDQVIDHLLVGPSGVYAIDSEQWDRRLPVRTKNGRQLWHGPFSQKERLEHARWEARQASELVGHALDEPITVRPAMAVYGPPIPWEVATIRGVDVFAGDRLRQYLRRRPRQSGTQRLTASDIARIYTAAEQALPPVRH